MEEITTKGPDIIPEKEPSSFRLIITLGLAGLFSGMLLVGVYIWTKPIIDAHRQRALQSAIYEVVPGSVSYKTMILQEGKLVEEPEIATAGSSLQDTDLPKIYAAYSEGAELIGFAIPSADPGFQDVISGIFGYAAAKKQIIGFVVLESKETPGLGDKIIKDQRFRENFTALSVEPSIEYVKQGQKTKPNQVDGITGATISSKTVVRLLENGLDTWKSGMEEYINGAAKRQDQ